MKNQGYHFEHNFGHGYNHLSVIFVLLMLLAFAVDQAQQLACPLFQAAWRKVGSKRRLWERLRGLFYDLPFTTNDRYLARAGLWLSSSGRGDHS